MFWGLESASKANAGSVEKIAPAKDHAKWNLRAASHLPGRRWQDKSLHVKRWKRLIWKQEDGTALELFCEHSGTHVLHCKRSMQLWDERGARNTGGLLCALLWITLHLWTSVSILVTYEGESQRLLCFQHCLWPCTIFTPLERESYAWAVELGGVWSGAGLPKCGKARHIKGSWNPFSPSFFYGFLLRIKQKLWPGSQRPRSESVWSEMLAWRCILTVCSVYASGFMDLSRTEILNCPRSSTSVIVKTHKIPQK